MEWIYNDGGREAAGFKGTAGDCVVRAIAIATEKPYIEVYNDINVLAKKERITKKKRTKSSARNGVHKATTKKYLASLGWIWYPTMFIGSGCKVHLHDGELPDGRLIVSLSKHLTVVLNGVIHDTHNPQRESHTIESNNSRELRDGEWRNENGICRISRRCVYGYWKKGE